ncbi:solute carrier family 23 protein [Actinomycetospora sp. NBRC 106378]|uniref:uracil-xanthine permease family protein n=1 Tax=Actinomycetospora sp. NBRC 106378 TaxID=3032208 RepID=UPI0024A5B915|nr:solute carrier family 23 protein [Actinomycetospora sp. NBRC 106378]GLZ55244.1 nitrate reductase [Actinomycetospora sp. NBRC 106378]
MTGTLRWTVHGDGRAPGPGEVVRPEERMSWGRTVGLGMQHVLAMFGATFVFPVLMGLDPNLAILLSGLATMLFLLMTRGRVPSYLGTSASFVGVVAAVRADGGTSAEVTGAIAVTGVVLALVGLAVHLGGARIISAILPPAVTGAVVLLIGFNLAPVVAGTYWPQDQGVALVTMLVVMVVAVAARGMLGRLAVLVGLVVGYVLSAVLDAVLGPITAPDASGVVSTHLRLDFSKVADAPWVGLPLGTPDAPGLHLPAFSATAILLVVPVVVALIAENTGHVKAVASMTREDLDPYLGRALAADGIATAVAGGVGGSPTTTYAENIGVMAATRVYSTAAYWVAAVVAVLIGFCPKFGAVVAATPGGVLGGITVVLYGMIGLLGARIWVENRVDFSRPEVLVPLAAGIVIGVGDVTMEFAGGQFGGIAFGTVVAIAGYHLMRRLTPQRPDPMPAETQETPPDPPAER